MVKLSLFKILVSWVKGKSDRTLRNGGNCVCDCDWTGEIDLRSIWLDDGETEEDGVDKENEVEEMDEDRVDGSIVVEFFEGVLFNSGNGGEVDEEEFKCEFEFEFKFWNFNSFVGVMLLRLLVDEVVKGSIESFSFIVEFDESSCK